jgi:hypothetical protein
MRRREFIAGLGSAACAAAGGAGDWVPPSPNPLMTHIHWRFPETISDMAPKKKFNWQNVRSAPDPPLSNLGTSAVAT